MSLVLGFVTLVNVCVFYLIFCILYIGCGHIPNQSPIAATLLTRLSITDSRLAKSLPTTQIAGMLWWRIVKAKQA